MPERETIDRELARYEAEQARELGLQRDQWTERIHGAAEFKSADRAHTTLLIGGLTLAHDSLLAAALRGLGYAVEELPCADNLALQFGKEFGNRGQCNPTYYTVGNLVKRLTRLRDEEGVSVEEIRKRYVFLTAGACGPCRFGMYVTEYRKALRDAGFDGFRVLLIQQQGGIKQASGDAGLKIDATLSITVVRAILAADVLNLLGYRIRPYEIEAGATDRALAECRRILGDCFASRRSVIAALYRCRRVLARVQVDRSRVKPVVSIVGEFWAMTTEGDGNYELQRFLEQEGAEVDIQGIVNWLLFMIWENRHDTLERLSLKHADGGRKGLTGKNPVRKLWVLRAAELAARATFQTYANVLGLHHYHLPNMDEIAELAKDHYDVHVRGGEGHMEVGKLIHFVKDRVNHLTISVKPFGCMPSGGVSDGVQAAVQARHPEALFLAVETTGDGKVNVQSRIQMMLFRAREMARGDLDRALSDTGMDEAALRARAGSRRWRSPFRWPRHRVALRAANLAYTLGGRAPV